MMIDSGTSRILHRRMCDDLDDLEETKKKVDNEIAKLRSLDSETFGK